MPAAPTPADTVETLFASEEWVKARAVVRRELKKLPAGDFIRHWWLARLSTTYYECRDYARALDVIREAVALAPACPLARWDLAGALEMLGRAGEAADVYRRLIGEGASRLGRGECGEGLAWANALVTDCYFRLAKCELALGDARAARRAVDHFFRRVRQGHGGIYPQADGDTLAARIGGPTTRAV
jgi:tetratricopeptide (TPR) repeat protein